MTFLLLVLLSLPVTGYVFEWEYSIFFYLLSILLILIAVSKNIGSIFRSTLIFQFAMYAPIFGAIMLNQGLATLKVFIIPALFIYVHLSKNYELLRASRYYFICLSGIVIYYIFFMEAVLYPGSNKITILFWNPNHIWNYLVQSSLIFLLYKRWESALVFIFLVFLWFYCGVSRTALLTSFVFLIYNFFPAFFLCSIFRLVFVASLSVLVLMLSANQDTIYNILLPYNDLLSGRVEFAFNHVFDSAYSISSVTDFPLLDIARTAPILFIVLLLYGVSIRPGAIITWLLVLPSLLFDSGIYNPISLILFMSFDMIYKPPVKHVYYNKVNLTTKCNTFQ